MSPIHTPPEISLIAAVGRNGAIGKDNGLLWRLPDDLRHFKRTTLGYPIIMGRKTWDSIGRPLPGRHNIVLTQAPNWSVPGVTVARSWAQALQAAGNAVKVFVMGGAQIYALALPHAHELVLTEVDDAPAADTYFPSFNKRAFEEVDREEHHSEALHYAFVTYRKL